MAKYTDFYSDPEVKDIMERFLDRFPGMFEGFNPDEINVIFTEKKKSQVPIKLKSVTYPMDVYISKPYIMEVFDTWWSDMNEKQKNLAVFHIMCMVPEGGFDETSDCYAKRRKPDINMFMLEFAACGGVADWFNNPSAKDPMERSAKEIVKEAPGLFAGEDDEAIPDDSRDGIKRVPVTARDIAETGIKEEVAASA